MNKKVIMLLILMISLITISSVSASENQTNELSLETNEISFEKEISSNNNEMLTVNEGTFTELQTKVNNGGTISLYKDYKYDNSVDSKLESGIRFNSITINGNNHVIDGAGQARIFSVAETSNVILKDIIFKNAKAPKEEGSSKDKGGSIYFYDIGGSKIINCTFIGNSAPNGGAIYWDYSGNAAWNPSTNQIINSTFINNSATYGAGVYWLGFGNFEVLDSNFNNNYASSGSSIYVSSSNNVLISNSYFNDSRQAIRVVSPNNGAFKLYNNVLSEKDYILLYSGILSSKTKIIVLENNSIKNPEVLKARITDDNNNTIKLHDSYDSLQFLFNGKSLTATQNSYGIWTANYNFNDGVYTISAKQSDFESATILAGTVYIGEEIPKKDINLLVNVDDIVLGQNLTVKISLDKTATGNILISIGDTNKTVYLNEYLENIYVNFTGVDEGNYTVFVNYFGDDYFNSNIVHKNFTVNSKIDLNENYGQNSSTDGKLDINQPDFSDNFGNDDKTGHDLNQHIIPIIDIKSNNLKVFYNSGEYYKIRIFENSEAVSSARVTVLFNGKKIIRVTDKNGWVKIKVSTNAVKPKVYEVYVNYKGVTVINKINVKSLINAKKISYVKKSSKSLKIKITLKGKNVVKKRNIKVKFRGKNYKLKTNSKGVATFKVTKNVIKKLKRGKTYSFTITFNKDVVKRHVKVK